jgi:general nucleoside transport system ATP-binding protein
MRANGELARLRGVTKSFGTLRAVDDFSISVHRGEVHGLVGGNGAGKTTAMKVLAGLLAPDSGQVVVEGKPVRFRSRRDALQAGIGFIQQEFSLVESLTCAENLLLGHPEKEAFPDRRYAARELRELGDQFEVSLDPLRLVRSLSMGERQQLEILIALAWGGKVLILDEPTSSTGEGGLSFLRTALAQLREKNFGVVYISHKLPEVLEFADQVTVLRLGKKVWEGNASAADAGELARHMVGDAELLSARRQRLAPGEPVLRITRASTRKTEVDRPLHEIDLSVRRHEIVGVAGVVGNGQRELARLAAGLVEPDDGTVEHLGRGVGYVAEDRARDSLALDLPLTDNAIVHAHRRPPIAGRWFLQPRAIREFSLRLLRKFRMDPDLVDRTDTTRALSGGNQQRLVLGRELEESADILILHNPARGLDVAATHDMFTQLDEFCAHGGGALLISVDLEELIGWADSICVLFDGRLTELFPATRDSISVLATKMAGVA